jgi:hypothetical protein
MATQLRRVSGAALLPLLLCSPPGLAAQAVDTAAAVLGLRDLAAACGADAGALWGTSLCGPVLLVDPSSRTVVASEPDSAGSFSPRGEAYVGKLPAAVGIANTAVEWGGKRWAMIMLPLPGDRFARIALLAHESFHRVQHDLGLWGSSPGSAHLDALDGRVWLRLELRALAAALRSTGRTALHHVHNALLFRAYRQRLCPGADTLERTLEIQEGLAEYTGAKLALAMTAAGEERVARDLSDFEARPTYVRSFAYATGPALGLLLDRYAPSWRADIARERDAAGQLAQAVRFVAGDISDGEAAGRAQPYGFHDVATEEQARAAARAARLADYRSRLVDGRLLLLQQHDLSFSFDPNTLVPLGAEGTVYPTGTFKASWGTLVVSEGGALVSSDFSLVAVPVPDDSAARPLHGPGWVLELTPGWVLRPTGRRTGDLQVARAGR